MERSKRSIGVVDDMTIAFDQLKFRDSFEKTITKPSWYNLSKCSIHRKYLVENLRDADERLHLIIRNGNPSKDCDQYYAIRNKIKEIFGEMLRHEMKFCRQNNVEQHFWKILFYNMIESTRPLAGDKSNEHFSCFKSVCLDVIDDGIKYFDDLLLSLEQTYNYKLNEFTGVNSGRNLKGLKFTSLALVSAQKFCVYIGDLLRYKEQLNESGHFEEAAEWYIKAYQLIPSNGMPSNQLAILALYNKRKFDAIFYHMRSLNASNPIKSAKESLVLLFDELRKKYQAVESQQQRRKKKDATKKIGENFKREIWVHPTDGQLNYHTVFLDQENETTDSGDLYKKFIFHFSHFHGLLFTRVGVDTVENCMEQTLMEFQELMNHRRSGVFSFQKLVKLIVINIFSVENHFHDAILLQYATAFSFTFIGIILNKLNIEFDEALASGINNSIEMKCRSDGKAFYRNKRLNEFKLSDSINSCIATIALWCNWLKYNWNVWTADNVLISIHRFSEIYRIGVWNEFAKFVTVLDKFDLNTENFMIRATETFEDENYKRFRLPEEMLTLGMPHILESDFLYCLKTDEERCVCSIVRLKNIFTFCSVELMQSEQRFLNKDKSGKYMFMNIEYFERDITKPKLEEFSDSDTSAQDVQEEKHFVKNSLESPETSQPSSPTAINSSDEIQKLLQRKNELEESHKLHEKLNKFTEEILQKNKAETLCIEVRPKYLIPDTNCFIDFLSEIRQLTAVYPLYHVIVPIVVLNELEGLAKGDESGSKIYGTPTKTSLASHKALVFLKNSGSVVKCATTKGSFFTSMSFTKEADNTDSKAPAEHLNNDDKILLTAYNLSKLHSSISAPTQSSSSTSSSSLSTSNVQRKVVLLTNDRNLRRLHKIFPS